MMTKKYYLSIAEGISKVPDRELRESLRDSLGAKFAAENTAFSWDKWGKACNGYVTLVPVIKTKPLRTIQPRPEPTKHMSDVKLGTIIEGDPEPGRDAIHVAVAPCVAAHYLCPGDHVGILEDGKAGGSPNPVGIVDPFLKEGVAQGQKFWVCLYPGTIKGLRHEWEHPAFNVAVPLPPPEPEEDDDGDGCTAMGCP